MRRGLQDTLETPTYRHVAPRVPVGRELRTRFSASTACRRSSPRSTFSWESRGLARRRLPRGFGCAVARPGRGRHVGPRRVQLVGPRADPAARERVSELARIRPARCASATASSQRRSDFIAPRRASDRIPGHPASAPRRPQTSSASRVARRRARGRPLRDDRGRPAPLPQDRRWTRRRRCRPSGHPAGLDAGGALRRRDRARRARGPARGAR